jgi:dipeptidyl aminopeptidase/acylaminoacyl peptidase
MNLSLSVKTCILIVAIATLAIAEQNEPLIPRSTLFSNPTHLTAKISPGATHLAFIKTENNRRQLLLAPVDNLQNAQPIAPKIEAVPLNVYWTPTGKHLLALYAADNARHLYRIDLNTGQSLNLTPEKNIQARLERLSHKHPNQALIAVNIRDKAQFDLFRIDLTTGQREPVLQNDDFRKVHCDAEFIPRVAERRSKTGTTDLLRPTADNKWQPFRTLDYDHSNTAATLGAGVIGVASVSPDGKTLFLVDNHNRDKSALLAIDIETGKERLLAEDSDADLRAQTVIDRFTGDVLAAASHFGQLRRLSTNLPLQPDFDFLEKSFTQPVGLASVSATDPAWLIVPFDGGPTNFQIYHRKTKQIIPLFTTHPALDEHPLATRSAHIVTSRDNLKLPCQLYLPPDTDHDHDGIPDNPLPTLLYVHGGPHIPNPWDSWFTNRNLQLLANRGLAVINVDFRGAGGYGKAFLQKGFQEWGGDIQKDIIDVARWAVDAEIAPKDRIGIWGWSFGGLSTMAALAFTPDVFACGISMYGLSDMEQFAHWIAMGTDRERAKQRVGDTSTDEGRARLKKQSPLNFADRITKPLLITHGGKDSVAPKTHSEKMVAALKMQNKPITYLYYPDEPHDYREPENWISFWAVAERFLHQHLGSAYETAPEDLTAKSTIQITDGAQFIPGLNKQFPS